MEFLEIKLSPVYMRSSGERLGRAVLREFQKEVAEARDRLVLLSAPTGSGKTVTLLANPPGSEGIAVGLYPNNELLCSQVAGLDRFIREYLGMRAEGEGLLNVCREGGGERASSDPLNVYSSDSPVDLLGRKIRRIYVAGMSGRVVSRMREERKLDVLIRISDKLSKIGEDEYAVVLATPDTFFLLAMYLYRDFSTVGKLFHYLLTRGEPAKLEELERVLRKCGVSREELQDVARVAVVLRRASVFADEFHLYGPYELSSFKALVYVLKNVHEWDGRLVLSSATPSERFVEELEGELGVKARKIDALKHVKESGDEAELVRGPVRLVFVGVRTGGRSEVSRLYGSSEHAYEVMGLKEFEGFVSSYKEGAGRGMVIVEKVSHARLFTEELHKRFGIKPVCMYSMVPRGLCAPEEPWSLSDSGSMLVVGTGAKIGQGVEFTGVTFGVVARVTSVDFLQSLSRIGRRYQGESTVLVPIDETLIDEVSEALEGRVSYPELAEWAERDGRPFLASRSSGWEEMYRDLIAVRESALKTLGSALHYRLAGVRPGTRELELAPVRNLAVVAPPDSLYSLAMFRSTGPEVSYCEETDGGVDCGEDLRADLGTIVRNFEVGSWKGKLLVKSVGSGDIEVSCKNITNLENLLKALRGSSLLVEWSVLRKWFGCGLRARDGELKDTEEELEDQLFLAGSTNEEFAEYVYRSGRGLMVRLNKGAIALLYV